MLQRESQVDRGYGDDDNDAEEDYEEEADGDEQSAYFTAIGSVVITVMTNPMKMMH